MDDTVERLLSGDHRTLSRLITLLERRDPGVGEVMKRAFPHTGRAYCVGITGPPGVGKSTIVDSLTHLLRDQGHTVGIVAVDPTSPFTGGALLGDRVRMQRHYLDQGVFIRSIATRGSTGGLPRVIMGVVRMLDASGMDVVLVETVGVGQSELSVMGVVDTVVVTLVPESGDAIQTLKAGIMEIADLYVVNKSDLEGANRMVAAIESMLRMAPPGSGRIPPILLTQANVGRDVDQLHSAIMAHRQYLEETSLLVKRRNQRRADEFLATVEEELGRRMRVAVSQDPRVSSVLSAVQNGELEPYSTALKVVDDGLVSGGYPFWSTPSQSL